jgi:hypothetical protein
LFLTVQDVVFAQVGVRDDLFGLQYTITETPDPAALQVWNLADYFDPNTPAAMNGPFDYRKGPQPPGNDPAVSTTPADLVPHTDIFNSPGDGFASVGGSGGFPTPMIMDNAAAQIAGLTESIAAHSYITISWTAPKSTYVDIVGHLTELAGNRGLYWRFNLNGAEVSNGVVAPNQTPHDFADGTGGATALESIRVETGDQIFLTVQDVVFSQVGIRDDLFGLDLAIIEVAAPAGIPGDYNENGVVDAADYVLWRDHLESGITLPNDSTAGVAADDYDRWRANFGRSAGAATHIAAEVPEMSSIALLTIGGCMPALLRRLRTRSAFHQYLRQQDYFLSRPLSSAKTTGSSSGGTVHDSGVFAASKYERGRAVGV